MPRQPRSNPLALAVLVCLLEAPMHPYQIAQTLRERAKEQSVKLNYGSLYAVVEGLERRGLVQARETLREGRRPERTVYEITDAGAREATDWLTEVLSVPAKEYPQLMAGLSFVVALDPADALAALRHRANALKAQLIQVSGLHAAAQQAGLPRVFALEGEYERCLLEAEYRFVKELVSQLEDRSLEGMAMWEWFHQADAQERERLSREVAARLPWPTLEAPPDDR